MGLAVWLLGEHPDQWSTVAEGVAPVDRAVEECARYEPVIRHGNHVAERDVELLGVSVPAGTLATVYLASAHRDPAVYVAPDCFDAARQAAQQEVVLAVTARWQAPRVGPGAVRRLAVAGEVDALPVEFEAVALR